MHCSKNVSTSKKILLMRRFICRCLPDSLLFKWKTYKIIYYLLIQLFESSLLFTSYYAQRSRFSACQTLFQLKRVSQPVIHFQKLQQQKTNAAWSILLFIHKCFLHRASFFLQKRPSNQMKTKKTLKTCDSLSLDVHRQFDTSVSIPAGIWAGSEGTEEYLGIEELRNTQLSFQRLHFSNRLK